MQRNIISELTSVFQEVFGDNELKIDRTTSAADIEQWDSLTHIELIVAVEQRFNIRFQSMDLKKLENVGDLADLVQKKVTGV